MRATVIGCGRWGSFIAWYLNKIGYEVLLYGRESSARWQAFDKTRSNGLLTLENSIMLTCNLKEAVEYADLLFISIASQNLRSLFQQMSGFDLSCKTVVLCMKGIEVSTGKRLTQVVRELAPETTRTAIWVGPGHVQDFLAGIPNCMVVDSEEAQTKHDLVPALSSDLIRFYYGDDLIGNEIGAASKNVIGIAAGMLDGLNKTSLKGALMSRGTREIARLIKAMGGNEISAYGLCHLGDYQATVFSPFSHNRAFGEKFVRGESYDELAEGVPTTAALLRLGEEYQVELPICSAVDSVIRLGSEPNRVLSGLFLRSLKMEF